jgi:integrase
MARSARSAKLETRSSRLKLPVAKKPVFKKVGPRVGLGYRRNQTAGTWVARVADGKGGNWTKAIGFADDFDEADGTGVFDFWQAQDRARAVGRLGHAGEGDDAKLVNIKKSLDRYEADLKTRGGDPGNVSRVRSNLPEPLNGKTVALLTERELRAWRDDLAKTLTPASVNRTCSILKAALNLAADHDARIPSRRPWEIGLATIPDAEESRNVILSEQLVRSLVVTAYQQSEQFGLLIEVAASTGARVSQLAGLEAQDVQGGREDTRLMMPSSRKGKGKKKITRRPVPVSAGLVERLAKIADGRARGAPLLVKPSGGPWNKSDHSRLFKRAVKKIVETEIQSREDKKPIKLDDYEPAEITIYALRHSNIVRQLLAGVPIRIVATNHDTSVAMIERTYSRHIGDHSDALARGALFEFAASAVAE